MKKIITIITIIIVVIIARDSAADRTLRNIYPCLERIGGRIKSFFQFISIAVYRFIHEFGLRFILCANAFYAYSRRNCGHTQQ